MLSLILPVTFPRCSSSASVFCNETLPALLLIQTKAGRSLCSQIDDPHSVNAHKIGAYQIT